MLNTRLDECFDILDAIQRTYRNYNGEYCNLVAQYPTIMNDFFRGFEADICKQFKMWPESQRADVVSIIRKEVEEKQAKLEIEALKEFEAKKAEEERLREEEAKKTGKAPAKAPAAKKAPGKDDKPQLDVPKVPMPEITDFESVMGNKYVREREFEEIAEGLLDPPKEEEEEEE